jgi:ankyrin repeat protein
MAAAGHGRLGNVLFLVTEAGADVNQPQNEGCTPLSIAAQQGKLAVVTCLAKELGADVNQANHEGSTPLCIATRNGHMSVVQCLVKEFGADVNQADRHGYTPLIAAAANKHTEVVVWLIKHGADAQVSHQYGGTVGNVSRDYGASAEQTEYLEARAHCANPGCTGAGLKKCAGCLKVFFCGPACIRAHWPAHKAECMRWGDERKAGKEK